MEIDTEMKQPLAPPTYSDPTMAGQFAPQPQPTYNPNIGGQFAPQPQPTYNPNMGGQYSAQPQATYNPNMGGQMIATQPPATGQAVFVTQPTTTTTVVNMMSNTNYPRGIPRDWSTPLCGCFENCGGCLCGWLCMPCYECHVASKMGESCCAPCCLSNATLVMRSHLRGRHNIQGSLINDACTGCWCRQCALCQLSRELDNIQQGRAMP